MENIMKCEQNPLNGSYLCYVPETPFAWSVDGKKNAEKFCDDMNKHIHLNGGIKLKSGNIYKLK